MREKTHSPRKNLNFRRRGGDSQNDNCRPIKFLSATQGQKTKDTSSNGRIKKFEAIFSFPDDIAMPACNFPCKVFDAETQKWLVAKYDNDRWRTEGRTAKLDVLKWRYI